MSKITLSDYFQLDNSNENGNIFYNKLLFI